MTGYRRVVERQSPYLGLLEGNFQAAREGANRIAGVRALRSGLPNVIGDLRGTFRAWQRGRTYPRYRA
jgi:hypothetical protein